MPFKHLWAKFLFCFLMYVEDNDSVINQIYE
jgi:hypothetical protein